MSNDWTISPRHTTPGIHTPGMAGLPAHPAFSGTKEYIKGRSKMDVHNTETFHRNMSLKSANLRHETGPTITDPSEVLWLLTYLPCILYSYSFCLKSCTSSHMRVPRDHLPTLMHSRTTAQQILLSNSPRLQIKSSHQPHKLWPCHQHMNLPLPTKPAHLSGY